MEDGDKKRGHMKIDLRKMTCDKLDWTAPEEAAMAGFCL